MLISSDASDLNGVNLAGVGAVSRLRLEQLERSRPFRGQPRYGGDLQGQAMAHVPPMPPMPPPHIPHAFAMHSEYEGFDLAQSRLSCGRFPRFNKVMLNAAKPRALTPTSIVPIQAHGLQRPYAEACRSETASPAQPMPPLPMAMSPQQPISRAMPSDASAHTPSAPLCATATSHERSYTTSPGARQPSAGSFTSLSTNASSDTISMPHSPAKSSSLSYDVPMYMPMPMPEYIVPSVETRLKNSYRQSGLDALDMAFWSGDGFYSDDEGDEEPRASDAIFPFTNKQTPCSPVSSTKPLLMVDNETPTKAPSQSVETEHNTSYEAYVLDDYMHDDDADDDSTDPRVSKASFYDDENACEQPLMNCTSSSETYALADLVDSYRLSIPSQWNT